MPKNPLSLPVALFYSYSHKDIRHREAMETILALLRRHGFLKDWSDAQIIPGQSISAAIQAELSDSDVVAFLLSPDFLASKECLDEWDRAKELASSGRIVFRVPIIVRDCPWKDHLAGDDVKALPADGKAITTYEDPDSAWQQVYEGIKTVVESLRTTFTPKPAFLDALQDADLPSSKPLVLEDIFVFPRLTKYEYTDTSDLIREDTISSVNELRAQRHSVIHGHDKSGKTGLAKHLALSLVNDCQSVLFADLGTAAGPLGDNFVRTLYQDQFNGDYCLWQQQENKTLIIDNMTDAPKLLQFIDRHSKIFSQIYLFVATDLFHSFLIDDVRLAGFREIRLEPLTRVQQETLIRKRLTTLEREDALTDGFVDQAEDHVNSVIISNRIVPRYPFFVPLYSSNLRWTYVSLLLHHFLRPLLFRLYHRQPSPRWSLRSR